MGLFNFSGGGSDSDESKHYTETTTTNTDIQDRRIVADANATVANTEGGTLFLTTTDHGSVDRAFGLGSEALSLGKTALQWGLDSMGHTVDSAFAFGQKTNDRAFDFSDAAMSRANSLASDALSANERVTNDATSTQSRALDLVAQAFTTSKDSETGNRSLVLAGLAVVGVVGALALWGNKS